jgi:hypothetical protein
LATATHETTKCTNISFNKIIIKQKSKLQGVEAKLPFQPPRMYQPSTYITTINSCQINGPSSFADI